MEREEEREQEDLNSIKYGYDVVDRSRQCGLWV